MNTNAQEGSDHMTTDPIPTVDDPRKGWLAPDQLAMVRAHSERVTTTRRAYQVAERDLRELLQAECPYKPGHMVLAQTGWGRSRQERQVRIVSVDGTYTPASHWDRETQSMVDDDAVGDVAYRFTVNYRLASGEWGTATHPMGHHSIIRRLTTDEV